MLRMMTVDLQREKDTAIVAARMAGNIINDVYQTKYTIDYKRGDNSPVTVADRKANQKIHEIVRESFPEYGWLSEETVDSKDRLGARRVWIVDPMDGTMEFINRIPEFSVSIGLIEGSFPILGVVYNPRSEELFWAIRGEGTWCNGRRIQVPTTTRLKEAKILSSRSETKRGEWNEFRELFTAQPMGSIAYKLACIAKGKADGSFTLVPKNEWDICAGTILVQEAGGQVTTLKDTPILFNQPKTLLQGLVASNGHLHSELMTLITPRLKDRHYDDGRK